ncbi:MAG: apolipoprotein N-acyltransferase [Microcoleaceae cyanobacterium]
MGFSAEPWGIWPLAWVALVPLWILVTQSQFQYPQPLNWADAIAWSVGYHGLALFWITGIHPMTWLGVPWLASVLIAIFCWGFLIAWGTGLGVAWAWSFTQIFTLVLADASPLSFSQSVTQKKIEQKKSVSDSILLRVLVGTALWCGLEWLWSLTPLWWSSLSYTQSFGNLVILHLGQLSGPSTITAAIVAINGLIAEVWMRKVQNQKQSLLLLLMPLGLFLIIHGLGFFLYHQPLNLNPAQGFKVGIIQGNIPNEIKLGSLGWKQALEGYTTGYKALADQEVDAVLTPETALPFLWTDQNRRYSSFFQAILEKKVIAWVGSFGVQGNRLTNSLFSVNQDGLVVSQYDKVHLVPLGEYIPFGQILGRWINRLSPLEADLIRGQPGQVFSTPLGQGIVGICYDSAFAEHFRQQAKSGGEFILTASNNAHYSSAMLAQHHAQDVMRAIETDRWTVRATNTGYSAIVDPHGKTVWKSQMNTYKIYAERIYRQSSKTLYVNWGDWLTPLLASVAALAVGVALLEN